MRAILLIIIILLLMGGPYYSHTNNWGMGPSIGIGTVFLLMLILFIFGII